jgi:hypothetical protein
MKITEISVSQETMDRVLAIPKTDLVVIAEREVIKTARRMFKAWRAMGISSGTEFTARKLEYGDLQCELLAAVTLLESREAAISDGCEK